jgi:hypothetical protein
LPNSHSAAFGGSHSGQLPAQLSQHRLVRLYRDNIGTKTGQRAGQDARPRSQIYHPHRPRVADRCQAPADRRIGVARAVLRILRGSCAE